MKAQPTPGPWKISNKFEITDKHGHSIALIGDVFGTTEENEANARLIVKTVNSHAKLVETLKTLLEDCNMALDGSWDKSDEGFKDMVTNIENALLAESEA